MDDLNNIITLKKFIKKINVYSKVVNLYLRGDELGIMHVKTNITKTVGVKSFINILLQLQRTNKDPFADLEYAKDTYVKNFGDDKHNNTT